MQDMLVKLFKAVLYVEGIRAHRAALYAIHTNSGFSTAKP